MDNKQIAKSYLLQISKQNRKLESLSLRIVELESKLQYPSLSYGNGKGSKRTDTFAECMAALVDLQERYAQQLLEAEILRERVLRELLSLDDARSIRVLYEKYFKQERNVNISRMIGLNIANTGRCHSAALSKFYLCCLSGNSSVKA